jgi:glutaredoxin
VKEFWKTFIPGRRVRSVAAQAGDTKPRMNPKRIRLFIKPYCPWCHQAVEWLNEQGIAYETLNVMTDEAAFAEMQRLSGQTLAPVIEVDGEVLADFGARELAAFWKALEQRHHEK